MENRELGSGNGERNNEAGLRFPVQQWAAGGANSPGILSFLAILTKMTHRPFGHEEQDGDNTRTAGQRRGSETAVL